MWRDTLRHLGSIDENIKGEKNSEKDKGTGRYISHAMGQKKVFEKGEHWIIFTCREERKRAGKRRKLGRFPIDL